MREPESGRGHAPTGDPCRLTESQQQVWHNFVDGGWALMAQVTAGFAAAGFSATDMRLLEILAPRDAIGISELAATLHAGVSTVSRIVSRLIDDGILERVASQADARHRLVRITEAGRVELDRQLSVRDGLIKRLVVDVVAPEQYESIGDAFERIRKACD
ncbi:MarR family winged helix-turn-helix transcriptional regulator [Gordonia sp. VNQ95]|jgi:DNA-binding MarR family transcriptional regulator|uniref:MarR family winged helix-turn-helix transcriptional regulator n=1 Tax=Gordonia TaxID=2053 RepID=UPI0032B5468A